MSKYNLSHDPIFQNMGLIFYMPIPYHFALTIKQYSPSVHNTVIGPCLIFSLGYLNEWICPWFSPRRCNIVFLFLVGGQIVSLASYNFLASGFWLRYSNFFCFFDAFVYFDELLYVLTGISDSVVGQMQPK